MSNGASEPVTPEAWEQALAAEFAAFMEETRARRCGRAGRCRRVGRPMNVA